MNPTTKEKLDAALANSKVFKLMSEEDQTRLTASLQKADDEQALQAIAVLSNHEQVYNTNEQKRLDAAASQIAMAEQIHQAIKKADQLIMKQDENAEQADNLQKLQSMEQEINSLDQKPTKKKKLFGVF
jgi:hypothetical protein